MHQEGDLFADPATAVVSATCVDATMKFSIGRTLGLYIDVTWQPRRPLSEGVAETSFSINGKTVASRVFPAWAPNSAPSDLGWAQQGGDALNLVQAMHENWAGTRVISGGGAGGYDSF